jgi:hypothetical protein
MREQTSIDARLSTLSSMATGTVSFFAALESLTRSMNRTFSELCFLGPDQCGVIMALGTGQISSRELGSRTSRTSRASGTNRASGTSRASRASGTNRASGTSHSSRASTGSEYQYRGNNQDHERYFIFHNFLL